MATNKTPTAGKATRKVTAQTASVPDLPPAEGDSPIDNGVGYEVGSKQFNLAQLAYEIEIASGGAPHSVTLSLTETPSEEDDPANRDLWITPAGISPQIVAQAVADHVPDMTWGVPSVLQEFPEVLAQLRADPDMDLDDHQRDVLLRGMALQWGAIMQAQMEGMG